jgi:hypothetical protein
VPAYAEGRILFDDDLTFSELTRRVEAGAKLVQVRGDRDGVTPLFIMNADQSTVVTAGRSPKPGAGQTTIGLAPASSKSGDARRASTP